MWLKRLIRPLIPNRIMARYRLHQHSRQAQSNVDVLVTSARERRRWLRATPDTYRVGLIHDQGVVAGNGRSLFIAVPDRQDLITVGDESDRMLAASLLGDADTAVIAEVSRPRLVRRRRVEPTMRPTAIATTTAVGEEVGGVPGGDLVGLHRRISDAGHRVRLVPRYRTGVDPLRHDSIDRPVIVVLAAVPMGDVGGGSRCTQLTLEFLRRGFHVVYVALFGSHESVDLGLRFIHPDLEQYRFSEFDAVSVRDRVPGPGLVILEVPSPGFEPAVRVFQDARWRLVYDMVDLWSDPALGGEWYRQAVEVRYLETADEVTASAPDLVERAQDLGADAVLVPNGVNAALFSAEPGPLPTDFPQGDGPVFGYHGSLYGDWFDWDQVVALATHHPSARVVLIGDAPATHPVMPLNVHFLGLKPQGSLPDYLARFDVGLLPFVVSPTTHAVSPLKVFEYLACGVPVAAPPLRALAGIRGVVTAAHLVDAVEEAVSRPRPDRTEALRTHAWEERVERMLSALGVGEQGEGPPPRVVVRPARHYARGARRL